MEVQTICNPVMYDTVILVMWCKSCILSCMEWEASEGLVVLVLHDYSNRVQYSFWHPYSEQVEVFLSICQADHTAAGSDCNFGQDLRLEKGLCSIFSQLSSCPAYVGKMVVAASVMVLQVHVAVKDGTHVLAELAASTVVSHTQTSCRCLQWPWQLCPWSQSPWTLFLSHSILSYLPPSSSWSLW